MSEPDYEAPRWMRDFLRFLPMKSQFVLSGNVRDLQMHLLASGKLTAQSLVHTIAAEFHKLDYANVVRYDPVRGFEMIVEPGAAQDDSFLRALELAPTDGVAPGGPDQLSSVIERFGRLDGEPAALLIDFSARLVARADALTPSEHQLFTTALIASHIAEARPYGTARRACFNTIVWIVDKEGDLPDWLIVDNPRIRHIPVAKPDHIVRRMFAPSLVKSLAGARDATDETQASSVGAFVEETEGLLLLDMSAIAELARNEEVPFDAISDAVRRYKVGVSDDPWRKINREKIRSAQEFIRGRVKGQEHAVTHMLDIVKRAVSGVGRTHSGRPRGVVFLAGPTGVGKTELAKTITSLISGDERAYIRFDMSEFSAEHSDQRLIGAPPGYVGYDAGGELTNAIREKPFSVVLFDEIEKAHPRILDKFLQILDDGVLTSGRGDRVYFSEALIVFTSNLGIYKVDGAGNRIANVSPDEPYDVVASKVRAEIDKHFKIVLNRPEILNRIGENIVIFDFIREEVANQIFDQMFAALLNEVNALGHQISVSPNVHAKLRALCLEDLSNGGRGVRNQIEAHIVNPLARALFDLDPKPGAAFEISGVESGPVTTLSLKQRAQQ